MYSPRPERHGVLCNMGMSRKEITFDLSQEALRQHYPRKETGRDPQFFKRAYKDIQRFMETNGFERRQYSVYVSTEKLTALDVALLTPRRWRNSFPGCGTASGKSRQQTSGRGTASWACCATIRRPLNSCRRLFGGDGRKTEKQCRNDRRQGEYNSPCFSFLQKSG